MAEIQKSRSKRSYIRIDMTPMVDLAFLLITFFMLATSFSKPKTMNVNVPVKDDTQRSTVTAKNTLTLLLGKEDKVHYYFGPEIRTTDFSAAGIRKVLLEAKRQTGKNLTVLIKTSDASRYKNLVDILDEMAITQINRYAIMDITPEDLELIKR
jgi:biopolymer transport protein ExbD